MNLSNTSDEVRIPVEAASAQTVMVEQAAPKSASVVEIASLTIALFIAYLWFYTSEVTWHLGKGLSALRSHPKQSLKLLLTATTTFVLGAVMIIGAGAVAYTVKARANVEAFNAPFNLANRVVAAEGSTYGMLPNTVGDFQRDFGEVHDPTLYNLGGSSIALGASTASRYALPDGTAVLVSATHVRGSDAEFAIRKLRDYAESRGRVGNFSIGMGEVSYIYFRIGDNNALAWSHGSWVYIVWGSSLNTVNSFVEAFPY